MRNDKTFLNKLLNGLWRGYRSRMEYARQYEALARSRQEPFRNDHIAFRTIAWGPHGIHSISRLFEALGYVVSGCYEFPDKRLNSLHYQHADRRLPKLFISQLKSWELSAASRRILARSLKTHRPALPDAVPTLSRALRHFHALPWSLPQRRDVEALNEESQFGAWTLLNGYNVNHFTASVRDIEEAVAAMKAAGIPMKAEIEGTPGSPLRQSSTEAVVLPSRARQGKKIVTMPWTYAYFELAERPVFKDPDTGRMTRFEGFFGSQAANLFEMTKVV